MTGIIKLAGTVAAAALLIVSLPSVPAFAGGDEAAPAKPAAADGKAVWLDNCAKCHGEDGKAQTKMGQKLKIPDMTSADWQGRHSLEKVTTVVRDGIPDTKMKAYGKTLTPEQLAAVSQFVKDLK